MNSLGWYTRGWVNRRSRRAGFSGNTAKECWYYKESWRRFCKSHNVLHVVEGAMSAEWSSDPVIYEEPS